MPINNLITVRKGTDTEWYASAAVLSAGEPGFDTTNSIFKIGDGTSDWDNLLNAAVFSDVAITNTASGSTPFSVEGTNGSLFSVVDNLDGTLMSVNNNAGLPVLEVFSDDSIVGGRFGQNDFVLTSSGNLGIGTSSPSGKLHIGSGDLHLDSSYGLRWLAGSRLYEQTATLGGVERMLYQPNGDRFEILTENGVAFIAGFHGASSSLSNSIRLHRAVGIGSDYAASGTLPSNGLAVQGNVGIGTSTPEYKLQVNGSFGATTKSFRIDHPSRPNYTLEYGSLESPYHGVRLTGRGSVIKGIGTISLPAYLKDLIHDDETINIQITNFKHGKTIYVDEINLNSDTFTVKANRAKTLGELQFFWVLTGVRKDVDKLEVEKEKI